MLAVGKTVETMRFIDGGYSRGKQVFEKGIEIINNGAISSEIKLSERVLA